MSAASFENVISEISQRVERRVVEQRLPGMAVGVVRDQELIWSHGIGHADWPSRTVPDVNTLFRVASITKTFTTCAILQLRDAGLLSLDDPLQKHIPEFSAVRTRAGTVEGVTIRRLLTHRSGITTEAPLPSWDALNFPTREQLLAALPDIEVAIPQDSAFKYSNLAFGLLGETIARVSGRPYEEYMQAEILEPLEMNSSVFTLTDDLRPRFATGYVPHLFEEELMPAPYAPLHGIAACGQLHSSVADLARWISLQFRTGDAPRGGAQVLPGTTIEESHRPQYLEPDWSGGYCLGWCAHRVGNHVYYGHGGGIHGFASQILFSKTHRLGAICLANVWPGPGVLGLATEILEALIAATESTPAPLTFDLPAPTPPQFQPFLGLYVATPGIPAHIAFSGGMLRLEKSPLSEYLLHVPATLEPTSDPLVCIVRGSRASGERAIFELNANGSVRSFALGGFVYRKLNPAEAL